MMSIASAIEMISPIENYHYDTENVLMNATNSNIENSTDCNFTFNLIPFSETIESNESYSRYFSALNPTNVLDYNCTDATSGSVTFYYDESSSETSITEIFIVMIGFIILCVIMVLIFKF